MTRVLAIDPTPRGFAFVILDSAHQLLDWGIKGTVGDTTTFHVNALAEAYCPNVLVLEDPQASRRCVRVRHLLSEIADSAYQQGLAVSWISRSRVRQAFGSMDKYAMARDIANHFPELKSKVPPRRKIWQSEPERINIFDAASLALTHYVADLESYKFSDTALCQKHDAA